MLNYRRPAGVYFDLTLRKEKPNKSVTSKNGSIYCLDNGVHYREAGILDLIEALTDISVESDDFFKIGEICLQQNVNFRHVQNGKVS